MQPKIPIPQLFYDLIAKILPGFLFIFALTYTFKYFGIDIIDTFYKKSSNSVSSIFNGIGYIIMCYLTGWFLRGLNFFSYQNSFEKSYKSELNPKYKDIRFSTMFHSLRIQNTDEAFRILKIKAEARMLESLMTCLIIILLISLCLIILSKLYIINIDNFSYKSWLFKNFIPIIILMISFLLSERKSWNRYYRNLIESYVLVSEKANKEIEMADEANNVNQSLESA